MSSFRIQNLKQISSCFFFFFVFCMAVIHNRVKSCAAAMWQQDSSSSHDNVVIKMENDNCMCECVKGLVADAGCDIKGIVVYSRVLLNSQFCLIRTIWLIFCNCSSSKSTSCETDHWYLLLIRSTILFVFLYQSACFHQSLVGLASAFSLTLGR